MQIPNNFGFDSTGQPETITMEVFNSQGAVIPQYSPVCLSSLVIGSGGGHWVTLPATARLNFFAGVTTDTIGTAKTGRVVISGMAKVRAWGISGWDTSKSLITVDGEDYVVFGTPTMTDSEGPLHHNYSITAPLAQVTAATVTVEALVRAM
jgi:hypothetical protein